MKNEQNMIVLEERVKRDLAQISTKLPEYSELSEAEQEKVKRHKALLDTSDIRSINKYGNQIFEQSQEDEMAYLQTLTNGELEIGAIEVELLAAFDKEKPNQNLLQKIASIGKKKVKEEINKQKSVADTTKILSEKTEKLRNELEQHYYRLQQMATNSAKERHEIELLIIGAQEKFEEIKQRVEEIEAKEEKSFEEMQECIQLKNYLNKLVRKIEGDKTRLITTTSRSLTATYLAQGADIAAYLFEQDVELAKPELISMAIFSSSRQIVTGAVDTYEKFQKGINEIAKQEAQKSVDTLKRINEISQKPLMDTETLREICNNTIEASKIVRQYHEAQSKIPTMGSEYDKIYQDFTKGLQDAVTIDRNPQITEISHDGDER